MVLFSWERIFQEEGITARMRNVIGSPNDWQSSRTANFLIRSNQLQSFYKRSRTDQVIFDLN
jgi:hypothetical protein